jgi:hypothetical protein
MANGAQGLNVALLMQARSGGSDGPQDQSDGPSGHLQQPGGGDFLQAMNAKELP